MSKLTAEMQPTIKRVGVVEAGLMGSGIAEVCARAGLDVVVRETGVGAAEAGRARLVASLDRGLASGKLTEAERDIAVRNVAFTTDFGDFADRQFVVEAVVIPSLLSAIRMMESGFATAEDIDAGMVEVGNHPMGPLHLTDLMGLDTTLAVAESLYAEFKEPLHAPSPLLSRMIKAGLLGRKTGRGFYDYARR